MCLPFGTKIIFVYNLGTSQTFKVPVMAQAVNRRPPTAKGRCRSWVRASENYVGKIDAGTGLSLP